MDAGARRRRQDLRPARCRNRGGDERRVRQPAEVGRRRTRRRRCVAANGSLAGSRHGCGGRRRTCHRRCVAASRSRASSRHGRGRRHRRADAPRHHHANLRRCGHHVGAVPSGLRQRRLLRRVGAGQARLCQSRLLPDECRDQPDCQSLLPIGRESGPGRWHDRGRHTHARTGSSAGAGGGHTVRWRVAYGTNAALLPAEHVPGM